MKQQESLERVAEDIDNEERITKLVKAAESVEREMAAIDEEETGDCRDESPVDDDMTGVYGRFVEQFPELESFESTGKITDITFDAAFEKEAQIHSIVELDENKITPKYVHLEIYIEPGVTVTEKFEFSTNRDSEFQRLLSSYGDGRLDSLLNAEVLLQPNPDYKWSSKTDKYDLYLPKSTVTSKLGAQVTKLRSKIGPRATEKDASLSRFLIGNSIRFGLTSMMVGIVYIYFNLLHYLWSYTIDITIVGGMFGLLLGLIGILLLLVVSIFIGEFTEQHRRGEAKPIGRFGMALVYGLCDWIVRGFRILQSLNRRLGSQL